MVKLIGVVIRRPDLTHEECIRYWREVHGPLALQLPGLRRYVQNPAVTRPGRDPKVDGFAEVWFDDEESLRAAFRSEIGRQVTEDEANFVDRERAYGVIVTEVMMLEESATSA